jgi:hypothetical protein
MHRPPLRGRPVLADKKVLLIDRLQATREARAAVLRSHGVEVHEAQDIPAARRLWRPHVYDLVMLDLRKYIPVEALEFYSEVMHQSPHQHFLFLLGPPKYLSRRWPGDNAAGDTSHGRWGEGVKRFLAAA